jgi:hypothetical protein
MIKLLGLVSTGKQKLNEIGDVPKAALAYIKPIYAAAAKKEGFKVTRIYESTGWPNAEIEVWQVTKQQRSGWVLGTCFTKAQASKLAKALKENLLDYDKFQESPATTTISKDHYYLSPYEAAEIGGAKYDDNKLRDLMGK